MKKSLAVLLCSSAMALAPGFAAFAAGSGGGGNGGGTAGGDGSGAGTTSGNPAYPITDGNQRGRGSQITTAETRL